MFKFRVRYFIFFIILFVIELCIGLFFRDSFIRPYLGDFLVVILIYCFIRSFFDVPVFTTAICVLFLSYTIELLQYFRIVELLGLQHLKIARILIGTSSDWKDVLAYTLGVGAVLLMEKAVEWRLRYPGLGKYFGNND
ncbi:MAG: DUF2809 domain-containing protein [Saprospiraceae bacterium]|nr:DUF2809 domain-containing protein [Saprospiraceae bacterium]